MADLILNRYKQISQAGEGGFGTVMLAWDTRMRRKVAIKCIPLREEFSTNAGQTAVIDKQEAEDDNQKTSVIEKEEKKPAKGKMVDEAGEHWFENVPGLEEARTAAMIQDSNIVTVYDFELENNMAYIIMEYVEGMTLTEFLRKYSDEMTLDMITSIYSGISHALEVAHAENVLHLDIKPDNVLIDKKGKVKVTDFGLATLADEFGFGTANAGTIGYMPPEQMRRQALDVRTDQWSLACITYEMLCGTNPFDADNIPDSLKKIEDSRRILPSRCWEDLNDYVDVAVLRALYPNIEDRYDSVTDFSTDLLPNLSSAKSGQRQIANLFKAEEEGEPIEAKKEKVKLSDRISENIVIKVLGRAFAIIVSLLITYLSCANIVILGGTGFPVYMPNVWGFIVLAVVLAACIFIPALGFSLSIVSFGVALFTYGNYFAASILIVCTILWMLLSGRLSPGNCNTTAAYPLFGCIGFAQVGPFLTGCFNRPIYAVINTVYGFIICVFLAALGSKTLLGWQPFDYAYWGSTFFTSGNIQFALLDVIKMPSVWIWGASWVLTSFIVSLFFNLKWRTLKALGCVLGLAIMILGICSANYFTSGMISWQPHGHELLPTIAAFAISIILAFCLPKRETK